MRRARFLVLALCGCGQGGGHEGGSDDGSSGDEPTTHTVPSSASHGPTTSTESSAGDSTETGGSDSTSGEETTGGMMPVEPCDAMPELPAMQPGEILSLGTLPLSRFHDFFVADDGRRIAALNHDAPITFAGKPIDHLGGELSSNALVAALSPEGALEWTASLHGAGSIRVLEVAVDGNGDVLAVGTFRNDLTIDETSYWTAPPDFDQTDSAFVAVFDGASGAARWVRTFTNDSDLIASAWNLVATDDGGLLAEVEHEAGQWEVSDGTVIDSPGGIAYLRFDDTGAVTWTRLVEPAPTTLFEVRAAGITRVEDGFATAFYADSGAMIDGMVYVDDWIGSQGYVMRMDEDGAVVRVDMYAFGEFVDIGTAPCDDVLVVGNSAGGFSTLDRGTYVTRITNEGELRWATLVQQGQFSSANGFAEDTAGQTVVTFRSSDELAHVTKLDGNGELIWSYSISGYTPSITPAIDRLDGVVVMGTFFGTLTVPGLPSQDEPELGAFLVNMTP